jgi:5-methylcytosine-specific restriction protein A
MPERQVRIDGKKSIIITGVDLKALRGKISKAQQQKKENPTTKGGNPTKRILISAPLDDRQWRKVVLGSISMVEPLSEDEINSHSNEFSPKDAEQEKEKTARLIALRRGQPKFRKKLLKVYENHCAVTGTILPEILEAAHIVPYMGEKTNHITNGVLLRADIHTLFDLGLLGISQEYTVVVSSKLAMTDYENFQGRKIKLPIEKSDWPSLAALHSRPLPRRMTLEKDNVLP